MDGCYRNGELITAGRMEDEPWYSNYQGVMEVMSCGPTKDHENFYEELPDGLERALVDCKAYLYEAPNMPSDEVLTKWIESSWLNQEALQQLKAILNHPFPA
jgi:hypothetical protein